MKKQSVLVIDDEPDIRELLEITLMRMGLNVVCAENFQSAVKALSTQHFDFCLTDMKLPDGDGISLVELIQKSYSDTPVAVITAHGNMELAIKAMKAGAYDFVSKPVSLDKLRNLISKGLETATNESIQTSATPYQIIGKSKEIEVLRKTISKFARSQAPVFVEGDSGTGKELVARQIHAQGARGKSPFIAVNCGAIPSELMESEFFGHKKGSFTGAITDNPGIFSAAEGGTLFLDEIADLPLPMQVKLLRVIQEKSIRPVGSHIEKNIDVRIISASHKNLSNLVEQGLFRQDLYYRINVISISVPALKARTEDISLLCEHLLKGLSKENGIHYSIDQSSLNALQKYNFPGNVRELENILERACALTEHEVIVESDLQPPSEGKQSTSNSNLLKKTTDMEADELEKALNQNKWNQSAASRQLGITLRQLRYRCQKYGLTK